MTQSYWYVSTVFERGSLDAWTPRLYVCDTHMCATTRSCVCHKHTNERRLTRERLVYVCATHTCETICVRHIHVKQHMYIHVKQHMQVSFPKEPFKRDEILQCVRHVCVRHIHVKQHMYVSHTYNTYMWHNTLYVCDTHMWNKTFTRVKCREMTCVWHDSHKIVGFTKPRLIRARSSTCVRKDERTHVNASFAHIWMRHLHTHTKDAFTCVLSHMCMQMTHSYVCERTRSHVWHDSRQIDDSHQIVDNSHHRSLLQESP